MGNACSGIPKRGRIADAGDSSVADASCSLLRKTHDPTFVWKICGFSALLERGATFALSDYFLCCGYKWCLYVTPMHKQSCDTIPYVALSLCVLRSNLNPGVTINAEFELSVFNHSTRTYSACEDSYSFHVKKTLSRTKCLIPLEELLKSCEFLVDDSCAFAVRILKVDVISSEKKPSVFPEKSITAIQNLFLKKEEFINGTYSWTLKEITWTLKEILDLKHSAVSPVFTVGGHKWRINIHPLGDESSARSLSLYLQMLDPKELSHESGMMIELTLSILDQKHEQNYSRPGRFVFGRHVCRGWPNFIPLETLMDTSKGYLVGSKCIVTADLTIIGSSIDGKISDYLWKE